ncbi:hypothetical protein [Rhodoblastus sp.]|uniref:hypothetical protein n=1 Tax=Rhodoblastus sp. TaxID=1962975 RepID=UPI003F97CC74
MTLFSSYLSRKSRFMRIIAPARGLLRQSQTRFPGADSPVFSGRSAPLTPPLARRSFPASAYAAKEIVMSAAIAFALAFLVSPLPGTATEASAPLVSHLYQNPQASDPLFSKIWPGLLDNNDRQNLSALNIKTEPGKHSELIMQTAALTIPAGQLIVSMYSGPFAGCLGIGEHHDDAIRAVPCPARITVIRGGVYTTTEAGMICRVAKATSATSTRISYDAKLNRVLVSTFIAGKRVTQTDGDTPCDRVIQLSQ